MRYSLNRYVSIQAEDNAAAYHVKSRRFSAEKIRLFS